MDVLKIAKKGIIGLLLVLISFLYFRYPEIAKDDTKNTLLLWLYEILPCQFAGMVLMGLWKNTGLTTFVEKFAGPVFEKVFGCSKKAAFVLVCGFLFGFPAGAYAMSLTMDEKERSLLKNQVLLVCSNVFQPAYLLAFVYPTFEKQLTSLGISKLQLLFYYDGLYIAYFFIVSNGIRLIESIHMKNLHGFIKIPNQKLNQKSCQNIFQNPNSSFDKNAKHSYMALEETKNNGDVSFSMIITNALVTSANLAGYMMFFSFLQIFRVLLPEKTGFFYCCMLEVSTALKKIMPTNPCLGLAALTFGGISCMAQLYVPLGKEFRILLYFVQKCILALFMYLLVMIINGINIV